MLDDEENVEEYGDEAEAELHWVAEERRPVGHVPALQAHLQDVETAAGEVEQHVAD